MIAGAGGIGGFVNAISTDNSFALPRRVADAGGVVVAWQTGVLGNMATAAVAALISWGLYGPSSGMVVVGSSTSSAATALSLTIGTLATAILIGYGGARWLTNEVDKRILKAAASAAAAGAPSDTNATRIANSSPRNAFRIATGQD